MGGHGGPDGVGGQLAVDGGAGDALVAGGFDGAGLVDADVAAGGSHRGLIGPQEGGDGGGVGLGAAHQQVDVGIGAADGLADQLVGVGRVGIVGIAEVAFGIGSSHGFQDGRMAAFAVIVGETDHAKHSFYLSEMDNSPIIYHIRRARQGRRAHHFTKLPSPGFCARGHNVLYYTVNTGQPGPRAPYHRFLGRQETDRS